MQRIILAVAALTFIFAVATPSRATLNACAAKKKICVAKKTKALLKCHSLAEKAGVPESDSAIASCVQKAQDKFSDPASGCFRKAEAGGCLTYGDAPTFESKVDAFVTDVVTELDPSYPAAVQNQCSAGKKRCVGKKAATLLKCHAKNEKPPGISPQAFADCLQRAKDRFDGGPASSKGCFAKLEAKFPGACLTTNDTATLETKIDAFVDDVVCELDSGSGTCPPPTPTPTIVCPGPTPTPDPNHACCTAGSFCADIPPYNAGDCPPGFLVGGGFCTCAGCVIPQP